jgi:hypothetical protein
MMTTLSGSELQTTELFDIVVDPKEKANLAGDPAQSRIVSALNAHIFRERAELMGLRGVDVGLGMTAE